MPGILYDYVNGAWIAVGGQGPQGIPGASGALDFAVPAITFGATHAEGVSADTIRKDAQIQFLVVNDNETIWPDGNTLTIVGGTAIEVNGDAASHTITIGVVPGDISHGDLADLGVDDHTIYLLADGSRALTGDWNAGAFDITAESFIIGNGAFRDGASGGYAEINGTSGVDLAIGGVEVIRMSATQFIPAVNNTVAFGWSTRRWSAVYALDGNFSVGLIMVTNADGWVLRANGTRFIPVNGLTTDTASSHVHSYWRPQYSYNPWLSTTGPGGAHSHVTI